MGISSEDDIENASSWNLFYRLRNVFKNADVTNDQQTFEAVQHVLEDTNVVDDDRHPDSPFANRPAYLDNPSC